MIVVPAHTGAQPYAMMIVSCNTRLAEAAMLAAGRFQMMTCSTCHVRVKYHIIIRVFMKIFRVILGGNGGI